MCRRILGNIRKRSMELFADQSEVFPRIIAHLFSDTEDGGQFVLDRLRRFLRYFFVRLSERPALRVPDDHILQSE